MQYSRHLLDVHYGILHCAFCDAMYPDFGTLGAHVKEDHAEKKTLCLNGLKMHTEM